MDEMTTPNDHAMSEDCIDEATMQPIPGQNVKNSFINFALPAAGDNEHNVTPNTDLPTVSVPEDVNQNNKFEKRMTLGLIGGIEKRRQSVVFSKPPDGGWGWVVVFSSFSISMLVDGFVYSNGIFFDEFREEFHTTKAETSWVGSVLTGSYAGIGPVAAALVKIYGCREVVFVGTVMASVAFFVSTFSNSITVFIITYSLLGGFGFGFMYLPAIVMVGYYFERRRALATGIACCGSGAGTFVFAPLCEYLIQEYGWRGATWITSALVLHGVVFALFYRPLPELGMNLKSRESSTLPISVITTSELADGDKQIDQPVAGEENDIGGPPTCIWATNNITDRPQDVPGQGSTLGSSHRKRPGLLDEASQPQGHTRRPQSNDLDLRGNRKKKRTSTGVDGTTESEASTGSKRSYLKPMLKKDIFYTGDLQKFEEYRRLDHPGQDQSKSHAAQNMSANHPGFDANERGPPTSGSRRFAEAISNIFDLSLLKSPTFLIYETSCCLSCAGFIILFIYLPTHVTDMGLESWHASSLISIIGIANTGMRIAIGYVADAPWADCLLLNNGALIIGGFATMFVTYLPNYNQLASYATLIGCSFATFVSLRTIIIVELMGLERLTTAFGLVTLSQGIGAFLGAPVAGFLSDTYGNYVAAFYLAGAFIAVSGAMCMPLRRIARWEGESYWKRALYDAAYESDEDSFCLDKVATPSKDSPDSQLETGDFVDPAVVGSSVDKPETKAKIKIHNVLVT